MRRLLSLVLFFFLSGTMVHASKPTISQTEGLVALNGRPARTGTVLSKNDVLKTYPSDTSYVDVRIGKNHKIRFKGARVSFESPTDHLELELFRGKAFPAISTDAETVPDLTITTPQAIMGIRGTKFFVNVTEQQTYTCVCEGEVRVRRRGFWTSGTGPRIAVPAGYDLHFYGDQTLTEAKVNPQMVARTWKEFADMGYEVPESYRDKLDDVTSP